ncbi:unnamed protein product, partial [Mesorhabditis spiculigera]
MPSQKPKGGSPKPAHNETSDQTPSPSTGKPDQQNGEIVPTQKPSGAPPTNVSVSSLPPPSPSPSADFPGPSLPTEPSNEPSDEPSNEPSNDPATLTSKQLQSQKSDTNTQKTVHTEQETRNKDATPNDLESQTALRPYHIPPEQFHYKGPVVLHNAFAGPKKHRYDDEKSTSLKGIQWDDQAHEAAEIGSHVEQIVDVAPEEEQSTMPSGSGPIEPDYGPSLAEPAQPVPAEAPAPPKHKSKKRKSSEEKKKPRVKRVRRPAHH